MIADSGQSARRAILEQVAESKLLTPLHAHGWLASIINSDAMEEYVIISAERNGFKHKVALLYTTATDNLVYKKLENIADITIFNGQPYMLSEFAHGLSRPVFSADDFHMQIIKWNQESAPGKLAPVNELAGSLVEPVVQERRTRRLLSETPIEAIWSRLSRLQSATLARKAVAQRAMAEGSSLLIASVNLKGDGVAYAIRNASDYFALKDNRNVSQRILNLYYGCMSFAFAEMLAAANGPAELSDIEDITKQGHGLWTFDSSNGDFESLAVGPLQSGFFPTWVKSMQTAPIIMMEKKPRKISDLSSAPLGSWATMEEMFARVPEIGDLFEDVFSGAPAWVQAYPDQSANGRQSLFGSEYRPTTTYISLIDKSGRMTAEMISVMPGPLREISVKPSPWRAREFRAAVDHPSESDWWRVLDIHHSPFGRSTLILPIFGKINQYRSICVAILYALSIIVRYRPSLWRRVQEGDLDHIRVLVETLLSTAERVLPEQFLTQITGENITIHQPGSLLG